MIGFSILTMGSTKSTRETRSTPMDYGSTQTYTNGGSLTKRREAEATMGYRHVAGESASIYLNVLSLA